jgi:polo-like kinase 1
MDANNNN